MKCRDYGEGEVQASLIPSWPVKAANSKVQGKSGPPRCRSRAHPSAAYVQVGAHALQSSIRVSVSPVSASLNMVKSAQARRDWA